jgi:hypothetical protein
MKQIIPFTKDLLFKTKVTEITSISLEHNLQLGRSDLLTGEFMISGDYKITDVSVNRENFEYSIPFEITLDRKFDISNVSVDIDDFYYEIINNEVLRVNIDVLVDGIEVFNELEGLKEEQEIELELVREGDDKVEGLGQNELKKEQEVIDEERINVDFEEEFIDVPVFQEIETPPVAVSHSDISEEKIKSLFDSFDDRDETFSTYHVYIVRKDDTIETIMAKYNITKEELGLYNKLDELKIGDKMIVPTSRNE